MIPANEENGCESGENDDAGEEDKDNDMNDDSSLEETGGGNRDDEEAGEITHEDRPNTGEITCDSCPPPEEAEVTSEGQELDSATGKSSMSSDAMPHHMERVESPAEPEVKKVKVKRERDEDMKKSSSASRPETPPLQRLMRQDPLPLFLQKKQHTPPKKLFKDGLYSHKFHVPPMALSAMSVIKNAPTHPKQTMIKAKMYSNKLPKPYQVPPYIPSSANSTASPHHSHHMSCSSSKNFLEEQPLDLSKKSSEKSEKLSDHSVSKSPYKSSNGHHSLGHHSSRSRHSSGGHSSSSGREAPSTLQSLQQRFGGNLHMRSVRKPISGLLPVIPDISKSHNPMHLNASCHLKNSSIPKKSLGGVVAKPPQVHSPDHSSKTDKDMDKSKLSSVNLDKNSSPIIQATDLNSNITAKSDSGSSEIENKYTMHRCTCLKSYNTLYGLSVHLQETGHLPASTKQAAIMEYPKLVRGQDMWLNQESEHTKRILRCMQCGESFKSLPMLTVHMMQTQHYTKIVSSEHGRRSHKCSAYCDREMDRECIFKCKVCNSTFSDMEGLANHMIMSGHHKKNILRSHNYLNDLAFRGRRKRYYGSEDAFDGLGNPNVASFLNYKRKCLSHPVTPPMNGHPRHFTDSPDNEPPEDSTISCENCGDRIETQFFVEHVRLCLRSKKGDLERSRINLFKDEASSIKSEKSHESQDLDDVDEESMFEKPDDSEEDMDTKPNISELVLKLDNEQMSNEDSVEQKTSSDLEKNKCLEMTETLMKEEGSDLEEENDDKKFTKTLCHGDVTASSSHSDRKEGKLDRDGKFTAKTETEDAMSSHSESPQPGEVEMEDLPRLVKQMAESGKSTKLKEKMDIKDEFVKKEKMPNCETEYSKDRIDASKNLDIIDPGRGQGDRDDNSALKAMESFIQKSFSSKFDYHRGNMVFNTSEKTLLKPSLHREDREHRHGALNRFEKYRKYFHQDEPRNNGSVKKLPGEVHDSLSVCLNPSSTVSSAKDDLKKLEKMCESVRKPVSPSSLMDNEDVRSTGNSENGETLASKYLHCDEEEVRESKDTKSGSSALDSLSSFVYGQPLNSEHPLDSLQKLITKTDLPKLLASSQSIKYLRQMDSPDSVLPLNLSLKKGQEDDGSDILERDGFSDHEGSQHSDSESDGAVEYRCAACSRHFASKGSYRYHLSRCHLSSVKRYGIKEAFNMSPYIYLPLDHTAKFSKYYEMAHELASKGK